MGRRLAAPSSRGLDAQSLGRRDHTILPYARIRQCVPGADGLVHLAAGMMTQRTLTAPFVPTTAWAHGGHPHPARLLVPTLPRPPQPRLASRDDLRSPLKDEPGCTAHTTFPNFGKVEYFWREGLTGETRGGGDKLS